MFKRGRIYYSTVRGGKKSLGTSSRAEAKALEEKWRHEAFERRNGLYVPTYLEAAQSWLDRNKHIDSYDMQLQVARWWERWFADRKVNEITADEVHQIMLNWHSFDKRKQPISETEKVKANATANRYIEFLAKIVRFACKTSPEFRKYPVSKGSDKWWTPEQWKAIVPHCSDDFRHIATMALATGLREENLMSFEWAWIHGDRAYLPATVTKTDKDYGIPLNHTAQAIIEERRKAGVRHAKYVFLRAGQQWYNLALLRDMERACKASGTPYITFHGLRHTFASWLAQRGVSDSIRKRLGCWTIGGDASSRYIHFDVESLRPYSYMLDPILLSDGAVLGQSDAKVLMQKASNS